MGRGRRAVAAGVSACLLATASACGGSDDVDGAGELGFIPGPGTVSITPVGERSDPIELTGPSCWPVAPSTSPTTAARSC